MYVLPEQRRRGHYRSLYAHVCQEAKAAGVCGIKLYTENSNATAHATYRMLGMDQHYLVFAQMFTTF